MAKKKTLDELEAKYQALDAKRAEAAEESRAVRREIDALLAEESAAKMMERMSDAERMALLQMLEAEGVASGVRVGGLAVEG